MIRIPAIVLVVFGLWFCETDTAAARQPNIVILLADDLASAEPQKANELKGLWDQWNQSLLEPLWPQQPYTPDRAAKQQ